VSDHFAGCAVRMGGLVCRQLGWLPADFWAATPAEITAIFAGDTPSPEDGLNRTELATLMERDRDG